MSYLWNIFSIFTAIKGLESLKSLIHVKVG